MLTLFCWLLPCHFLFLHRVRLIGWLQCVSPLCRGVTASVAATRLKVKLCSCLETPGEDDLNEGHTSVSGVRLLLNWMSTAAEN